MTIYILFIDIMFISKVQFNRIHPSEPSAQVSRVTTNRLTGC